MLTLVVISKDMVDIVGVVGVQCFVVHILHLCTNRTNEILSTVKIILTGGQEY